MNNLDPKTLYQLPLSWARTKTAVPALNKIKLPYSSTGWIPTAEIPLGATFDEVYREHLATLPNGFVLQSCGLHLRDYLLQQGCQAAPMGAEAILDLPWRGKRSVRDLARRGRRHGFVREIELGPQQQHKLARLIKSSSARQGVQLRHTERTAFDASTRCFVFETVEKAWVGAITLSRNAPHTFHTELLLRHREAPVGIMEALITAIAEQLTLENVRHLSLGAVTPIPEAAIDGILAPSRHLDELWRRSQLAFRLARGFNFAFNAEGLWRFKNKFSPRWEPLYLCASPRLNWTTMAGLLQATGYVDLVKERLLDSLPLSWPGAPPRRPSIETVSMASR